MGSFRRSRPRFMSSPVLSDLSRFQAGANACNSAIWNSVQSAVMKVFRGGALQPNELYALNENIRWLLKSEMGPFVTDYLQNRLLANGLKELLERIGPPGEEEGAARDAARLAALAEAWRGFFTETLPTLQAIFYPLQAARAGEPSVRRMALLAFRDSVLLRLPLEGSLPSGGGAPPAVTHMLLVLQGVREGGAASSWRYRHLERLAAMVVWPYLGDVLISEPAGDNGSAGDGGSTGDDGRRPDPGARPDPGSWPDPGSRPDPGARPDPGSRPDPGCSLAPLVEHEGEAYLEKAGGARRHTVADARVRRSRAGLKET